ncbi:autophagy-related protein 27 [Providencia rettgeri]
MTELEGDGFFNWFFLISSVIILFISAYLIKKLEFLRN